jgi:hypothetical protein
MLPTSGCGRIDAPATEQLLEALQAMGSGLSQSASASSQQ